MAGPITRRRLLAAGVALATATLPGCLGYRTDREIEHDLSRRVLACLNEDDADGLEALFCEASRARPELRAEIARGMGFFEGRVDLSAGWREGGWSTVSGAGCTPRAAGSWGAPWTPASPASSPMPAGGTRSLFATVT